MAEEEDFDIQIIIASGYKNYEKATLGFATACACATSGGKVVVFLSMEGAVFAAESETKVALIPNFETIERYTDILLEAGAKIEVCSTCAENFVPTFEMVGSQKKIKKGLEFAGLSTAAIRALKIKTMVF